MVHLSISGKEKECLCSAQHPDRRWGHVKKKCDTDEGRRWGKNWRGGALRTERRMVTIGY